MAPDGFRAPGALTAMGLEGLSPEEYLEEALLTIREVFDYVSGVAEDMGGATILQLDYEIVVVRVPSRRAKDYMEVIAGLADETEEKKHSWNLTFYIDTEHGVYVNFLMKQIHRETGWSYIAVVAKGLHCLTCKPRELNIESRRASLSP